MAKSYLREDRYFVDETLREWEETYDSVLHKEE